MPKINQRLNGQNPLAYMGVDAGQPTDFITDTRDPLTSDYRNVFLGAWWLNTSTNALWYLVSLKSSSATWLKLSSAGQLITLTGNTGGPIMGDSARNINIVSGSSAFTITGNPGTNTLTITSNGTIGTQYDTDSGNAVPSAGVLNIVGGLNINTSGSGNTVIIKTPTLAEGIDYANSSHVFTSLSKGTNGQILIGATAGIPAWANITSAGGTVTITNSSNAIDLEVPGGSVGVTSGFSAYLSTTQTNVTGDGTQYLYKANTVIFDIGGSDYNPSTGIFTAPSTGYYFFGAYCQISNIPDPSMVYTANSYFVQLLSSTGATYQLSCRESEPLTQPTSNGGVTIISMTMHDTIKPAVTVGHTTKVISLVGGGGANPIVTTFFGYRLP